MFRFMFTINTFFFLALLKILEIAECCDIPLQEQKHTKSTQADLLIMF